MATTGQGETRQTTSGDGEEETERSKMRDCSVNLTDINRDKTVPGKEMSKDKSWTVNDAPIPGKNQDTLCSLKKIFKVSDDSKKDSSKMNDESSTEDSSNDGLDLRTRSAKARSQAGESQKKPRQAVTRVRGTVNGSTRIKEPAPRNPSTVRLKGGKQKRRCGVPPSQYMDGPAEKVIPPPKIRCKSMGDLTQSTDEKTGQTNSTNIHGEMLAQGENPLGIVGSPAKEASSLRQYRHKMPALPKAPDPTVKPTPLVNQTEGEQQVSNNPIPKLMPLTSWPSYNQLAQQNPWQSYQTPLEHPPAATSMTQLMAGTLQGIQSMGQWCPTPQNWKGAAQPYKVTGTVYGDLSSDESLDVVFNALTAAERYHKTPYPATTHGHQLKTLINTIRRIQKEKEIISNAREMERKDRAEKSNRAIFATVMNSLEDITGHGFQGIQPGVRVISIPPPNGRVHDQKVGLYCVPQSSVDRVPPSSTVTSATAEAMGSWQINPASATYAQQPQQMDMTQLNQGSFQPRPASPKSIPPDPPPYEEPALQIVEESPREVIPSAPPPSPVAGGPAHMENTEAGGSPDEEQDEIQVDAEPLEPIPDSDEFQDRKLGQSAVIEAQRWERTWENTIIRKLATLPAKVPINLYLHRKNHPQVQDGEDESANFTLKTLAEVRESQGNLIEGKVPNHVRILAGIEEIRLIYHPVALHYQVWEYRCWTQKENADARYFRCLKDEFSAHLYRAQETNDAIYAMAVQLPVKSKEDLKTCPLSVQGLLFMRDGKNDELVTPTTRFYARTTNENNLFGQLEMIVTFLLHARDGILAPHFQGISLAGFQANQPWQMAASALFSIKVRRCVHLPLHKWNMDQAEEKEVKILRNWLTPLYAILIRKRLNNQGFHLVMFIKPAKVLHRFCQGWTSGNDEFRSVASIDAYIPNDPIEGAVLAPPLMLPPPILPCEEILDVRRVERNINKIWSQIKYLAKPQWEKRCHLAYGIRDLD